MLSKEENLRLTQVGPGTPGGALLRSYWHPIAASSQLPKAGTRPVTVLGESLVLYRDKSGEVGLIAERCPHRAAGMVYGVPEQDGLRCAYHGWLWDGTGRCLAQPYEDTADPYGTFKDRVRITAYPVEEQFGMIFAYLGPEARPLLPHWDLFVQGGVRREIGTAVIPCNWVQITENSLDPVHVEWLHQHFTNYVLEQLGREDEQAAPQKHTQIGFSVVEYGIVKRRLLEGDTEAHERWATGHPLVFPTILKAGSTRHPVFQIRLPIDDTRTQYWWYSTHPAAEGEEPEDPRSIPVYQVPVPTIGQDGTPPWNLVDNNSGQDAVMWYTQGPVTDREQEHLGLSDQGVILFRKLMKENTEKVERGEDPMNVFRDPARNMCLELPVEKAKFGSGTFEPGKRRAGNASKYSVVLHQTEARAETAEPAAR